MNDIPEAFKPEIKRFCRHKDGDCKKVKVGPEYECEVHWITRRARCKSCKLDINWLLRRKGEDKAESEKYPPIPVW